MSMKVQIIDNDDGKVLFDSPEVHALLLSVTDNKDECETCMMLHGVMPELIGACYASVRRVELKRAEDPLFDGLYKACQEFCDLECSADQEVQSE